MRKGGICRGAESSGGSLLWDTLGRYLVRLCLSMRCWCRGLDIHWVPRVLILSFPPNTFLLCMYG